ALIRWGRSPRYRHDEPASTGYGAQPVPGAYSGWPVRLERFSVVHAEKTNFWSAQATRYCWRNPPCPSFNKGGDPKAPFCKGGRAERGGIWTRCGNEENIRQQYLQVQGYPRTCSAWRERCRKNSIRPGRIEMKMMERMTR